MKKLRVVGALVLITGLCAGGYWWFTRVDRAVEAALRGETWRLDFELLTAHGDSPNVAAAAVSLAGHLGQQDCTPERLALFDAVFSTQKLPDAVALACVVNRCPGASVKKWLPYPGAQVAHAVRQVLRDEFRGSDTDPLITWLEDSRAGVSEDVLVAVALALGTSMKAARYFEVGFPADGQPLGAEPRTPPGQDPRLPAALAEAVLQYGRLSPTDKRTTPAIAKAAAVVKVPVTDEVIAAVARMDSQGLEDAARAILGGAEPERVRQVIGEREDWAVASGRRATILEALGAGAPGDIDAIFVSVRGLDGDAWTTSDGERLRQQTLQRSRAGVSKLGARAVPAARKYLSDSDAQVRALALDVLFEHDRANFIEAVFEASPKLSYRDLERALELAGSEDQQLLLHFAALAQPALVEKVKAELLKRPAAVLVPSMFALMARRESFSPEEVAAYQHLLAECPGSGPATATALSKALDGAGGDPERVYWLTKLLGLKHLSTTGGGAAEKAVVAKFLADSSGYDYVRIKYVNGKEVSREPTRVTFASLATEAMGRFR